MDVSSTGSFSKQFSFGFYSQMTNTIIAQVNNYALSPAYPYSTLNFNPLVLALGTGPCEEDY